MKQINHYNANFGQTIAINASDTVYMYVFTAGSTATVTIPAGASVVTFGSMGSFSANFNGQTASGAPGTTGNSSVVNPASVYIRGQQSFTLWSPAINTISVSFYVN